MAISANDRQIKTNQLKLLLIVKSILFFGDRILLFKATEMMKGIFITQLLTLVTSNLCKRNTSTLKELKFDFFQRLHKRVKKGYFSLVFTSHYFCLVIKRACLWIIKLYSLYELIKPRNLALSVDPNFTLRTSGELQYQYKCIPHYLVDKSLNMKRLESTSEKCCSIEIKRRFIIKTVINRSIPMKSSSYLDMIII